jgi:hypothetical protein
MNEKTQTSDSDASAWRPPTEKPGAAAELQHGIASGAHDISEGVKHLAEDVVEQAKTTAGTALGARKDEAVEGVRSVARALRKTGEHLQSQNQTVLTDYVGKAADRIDEASHYLQSRTLGQVLGDVENLARREPALFLGGAFVAGLIGGRFLKSSSPSRANESHESRGAQSAPFTQSPPMKGPSMYRPSGQARSGIDVRRVPIGSYNFAPKAPPASGSPPQSSYAAPPQEAKPSVGGPSATPKASGNGGTATNGDTRGHL